MVSLELHVSFINFFNIIEFNICFCGYVLQVEQKNFNEQIQQNVPYNSC